MEIWNGRPEITPADHPLVVYRALRNSIFVWQREETEDRWRWWKHTAENSWETLESEYSIHDMDDEPPVVLRPEGRTVRTDGGTGKARLYISFDHLEYALVCYGVDLINNNPEKHSDEINRVDDVLIALDKALKRKKY